MSTSPDDLLKGVNILIVDDDARNTFALSSYLGIIGMQIHTAENGFQAIAFLSRQPDTDIILMDMMMPEMDGYEAIDRIRANWATRQIPIIAVTAKAMKGDREKCLLAGASEYVSKPISMPELLEKMVALLHL
jgi:two-component system, chemotaxis family, sensor kinase CheA